ncbi:MAG: type II secretion system F family protein [Dehalococcoidales bacterium]
MIYQYIACGESGDIVKGKITAGSEDVIADMMSYAGYRLINLRPYVPFLSLGNLTSQLFPVKPAETVLLYRQMALLLESGINIVTALELLQEQIANRSLKRVVAEMVADLRGGNQLSAAMSRHPDVFSTMACRTIGIGEQTGGLETMLKQIADYTEKEIITKKGIKGALMYPMIAMVVAVGVVGLLMVFVMPAFAKLYGDLGAKMPILMTLMMGASAFLRQHLVHIFLGTIIVVGLGLIYIKTPDGKYRMDALMLRIPQLGRVKHLNELSRCCRSISLLFNAGLPLTEIMPLVIQGANNRVMSQSLYNVQVDMLKGEGLAKPMAKDKIFLPMMVQMVKVGEESGSLDASLLAVAQNYESEAQDKTKTLIAMIQPVMTIVIAGVVGLIAVSMVSAMYSIYGQAF